MKGEADTTFNSKDHFIFMPASLKLSYVLYKYK